MSEHKVKTERKKINLMITVTPKKSKLQIETNAKRDIKSRISRESSKL